MIPKEEAGPYGVIVPSPEERDRKHRSGRIEHLLATGSEDQQQGRKQEPGNRSYIPKQILGNAAMILIAGSVSKTSPGRVNMDGNPRAWRFQFMMR